MFIVVIFLLVLSALVLIHELGHFLAARIFGVKADEFGYGFPPRIVGIVKDNGRWKRVGRKDEKEYKNTIWSINWLPLGGFVRIKGENGEEETLKDKDAFASKAIWKRIVILAAGVTMNWLLAFAIFAGIFTFGATTILDGVPADANVLNREVRITSLLADAPAAKAGLQPGDKIVSIGGETPDTYEDAQVLIAKQNDQPFEVKYDRDGAEGSATVSPIFLNEINKFGIGVGLADVGVVRFRFDRALWYAGETVANYTKEVVFSFGTLIRDIVLLHHVEQDVAGPIGIAVITGQVAKQGIVPLLQFTAILSINLAVVNFLPIPALDGGRVLFLVIEKVRRRAMARRLEARIHQIAFISLIILILLVTLRDIGKYSGVIWGGIRGIVGM
ncbi:MAG: M50 family metallopeptidase [Patescibacteria group bacterium]|nr:M50 family metallopeptidase [Patescibacteria group bacterium]